MSAFVNDPFCHRYYVYRVSKDTSNQTVEYLDEFFRWSKHRKDADLEPREDRAEARAAIMRNNCPEHNCCVGRLALVVDPFYIHQTPTS